MSAVTFNLGNLTGDDAAPLFCQYPREYQPQPAHVEMDQHGEVSAGYCARVECEKATETIFHTKSA